MRLIDADVLPRHGKRKGIIYSKDVDNAPTIDAVPVVRCIDCKHSHFEEIGTANYLFCEMHHDEDGLESDAMIKYVWYG